MPYTGKASRVRKVPGSSSKENSLLLYKKCSVVKNNNNYFMQCFSKIKQAQPVSLEKILVQGDMVGLADISSKLKGNVFLQSILLGLYDKNFNMIDIVVHILLTKAFRLISCLRW